VLIPFVTFKSYDTHNGSEISSLSLKDITTLNINHKQQGSYLKVLISGKCYNLIYIKRVEGSILGSKRRESS